MRGLSGIVFLMSSTVIATQSADANTSVERSQDGISFTITGEIGDSDSGIFEAVRSELNRKSVTVYLNSEGGDAIAAMRIGRLIREGWGTTFVAPLML